jgi:DNA-directed RNA polymerase alpha subunit
MTGIIEQGGGASANADQALAVPVEPVARLDPAGFDPSRCFAISLLHSAWIGELEISQRAYTVFKREGIVAVAFIENATDRELLAMRGFGKQALRDTRDAVNRFRERWHKHGTPFTLASEKRAGA